MALRILAEFKEILDEIDWMDEESRQRAHEKADLVSLNIGYPDYYKNSTYIKNNFNVISFFFKFIFRNFI